MSVDRAPRPVYPSQRPIVLKGLREKLGLTGRLQDMPASAQWAASLARVDKPWYAGTVPHDEVQRRRAANRRAKASRKINRGRS